MSKLIYISEKTEKLLKSRVFTAIEHQKDIEKPLVMAIIKQESNFYPFAIRYEPQLKRATWYKRLLKEKDNDLYYCSFGLMQILFGIAVSFGFKKDPFSLFYPEINIYYGTKYLKNLMQRYKNIKDVISAYNQGSNKKDRYGNYKNQEYVDKVYRYYKMFGGKL